MHFLLRLLIGLSISLYASSAEKTIHIENAWINEAPPTVSVVAGYMTIKNNSSEQIDLIKAKSSLFERTEFHLTYIENGIAKMRKQEIISIQAQSEFSFSPGNYHLMLFNTNKPLRTGDLIPIELTFSNGHIYTIDAIVKRVDVSEHHYHH